jgi:hypothetical protein
MRFTFEHPSTRKMVEKSVSSDRFQQGIECFFVPISRTIGLKVFPRKISCERAMSKQARAAAIRIAPTLPFKVVVAVQGFDVIAKKIGHDKNFPAVSWGYFTHIAKRARFYVYDRNGDPCKRLALVVKGLKKLGMSYDDLHEDNVGVFKGRAVSLDFGAVSTNK